MEIELKNIGIVEHAKIDMDKNLLIFCGPNNTGKTYVAYTLYGIHENLLDFGTENHLIEAAVKSTFKDGEMIFTFQTDIVRAILREKEAESTADLDNVFAAELDFFSASAISIDISNEEIVKKIQDLTFRSSFGTIYYDCIVTKAPGSNTASIRAINKKSESLETELESTYKIIAAIIRRATLRAFFKGAYIAPAERIAINIFSKELSINRNEIVDSLLETDSNKGIKDKLKGLKRYSLPIRDSVKIAEDLANLQKNRSDYYFLADLIEQDILKGKVSVSSDGDMQFNPDNANIRGLDIHLTASMIKSLSNLVFYFRRLANKNDFIIIDEPELNLHPDNQIIMARILARIVNEGFKVLISTHSDYIIKELNNLIRLKSAGERSASLMKKYDYKESDLLDKDNVGVYLFKDKKAVAIAVDELGFDIFTIENENSKLAEISESIYFDLLDK